MSHSHHFAEGRDQVLDMIPERLKRAGLILMGFSWLGMAWSYLGYINTDARLWHPEWVLYAFVLAGLSVLCFVLRPYSRKLFLAASVSTMMAWCLRSASIIVIAATDTKPYWKSTISSQTIGLFWVVTFIWVFWQFMVLPWHKDQRAYHLERQRRGLD